MFINDIAVDIHSDMMLFADDTTVVKFVTDREKISRIINYDLTTLDGKCEYLKAKNAELVLQQNYSYKSKLGFKS